MEKTLIISGKPTKFKCTGGFLIRYKQLTGRDLLKHIMSMESTDGNTYANVDEDKVDTEILFNIIWILAKTTDNNIPDLLDWLDEFESFPIAKIMMELQSLLANAFESSISSKDNQTQTSIYEASQNDFDKF